MKKLNFILIFVLLSIVITAQEKGSYITIGGGLGPAKFNYDFTGNSSDGSSKFKLGANGLLGYSYFFSRNWGVGTGVGVSYYNSVGTFGNDFSQNNFYNLGSQVDDDNISGSSRNYELRARLANWEERQTAYLIDVPVMIQFQHKFGERQWFGIYAGAGVKFQFPVQSKYKVMDGENGQGRLNISGYYPTSGVEYGVPNSPDVSEHGFGTISDPHERFGWEGDIDLKTSITGTAELGFLFGLGRRVDLFLGAFIDYGFNDIKKGDSKAFMSASQQYLPAGNYNVGNGIEYNGMINSDVVDKVNLFSYGGKLTLRIKIGRLENDYDRMLYREHVVYEQPRYEEEVIIVIDSVVRPEPIAVQPRPEPTKVVNSQGLTAEEVSVIEDHVWFDLNMAILHPEGQRQLDQVSTILMNHPNLNLIIYGNTCDRGNDEINIPLGKQRAESAKNYLINKGINGRRITTQSESSYKPLVPNTNETNRSRNRRCDFETVIN